MINDFHVMIDATNDDCPLPTIRAKFALDSMSAGEILKLITNKEGTIRNIRTFVANNQCELLSESKNEEGFVFLIEKS